jgi:hypothetical protein
LQTFEEGYPVKRQARWGIVDRRKRRSCIATLGESHTNIGQPW